VKKLLKYFIFIFILINFEVLANYRELCDSLDNIKVDITTGSVVKINYKTDTTSDGDNSEDLKCLFYDSNSFTNLIIENEADRLNTILKNSMYKQIIFPAKTFEISVPISIPRSHLGTSVTLKGTTENDLTTTLIATHQLRDKFIFVTPDTPINIGDKGLVIENFILENNQCTIEENINDNSCGILKYVGDGARINNNLFISDNGQCIFHNANSISSAPGYNNLIANNAFECRNAFYAPEISHEECNNNKEFCSLPTDQFFVDNTMSCGEICIKGAGLSGTQFIENQFQSDEFAILDTGRDYWISLHKNKYKSNLFRLEAFGSQVIEPVFTYPGSEKPESFSYIITGNDKYGLKLDPLNISPLADDSNIYNLHSSTSLCNQIGVCQSDISLRFNEIISYANGASKPITLYVPDHIEMINNTETISSNLTLVGAGSLVSSITFKNPLDVVEGGTLIVKNISLKGFGSAVINIKNSNLTLLHSNIGKYEGDCIRLDESKKVLIEKSSFYNCNVGINGSFDNVEPNIDIYQSTFSNVVASSSFSGPREIKSFIKVAYNYSKIPRNGSIKLVNNHLWGDPTEYFFDIRNVKTVTFEGNDIENLGNKAITYGSAGVDSKVKLLKLSGNSNATFSHNILRVSKLSDGQYSQEYLIDSDFKSLTFDSNVISLNVGTERIEGLFNALEKIKLMPLDVESLRYNEVFKSNTNKIKWFHSFDDQPQDIFDITMNRLEPDSISATYSGKRVNIEWTGVDSATEYTIEYKAKISGSTSWSTTNWISLGTFSTSSFRDNPNLTLTQNSGFSYQYRVKSCISSSWCSEWVESDILDVLLRPNSLSASVINNKDIKITWSQVPYTSFYERETSNSEYDWNWSYRKTYQNSSVTYLNQTPRSSKYRVRACNSKGCSEWVESNQIGIIPPPPESVGAWITPNPLEPNKSDMNVHWSWVRGATYYIREVFSAGDWRYPTEYNGTSVLYPLYNSGLKRFRVKACIDIDEGCSDWAVQPYEIRVP